MSVPSNQMQTPINQTRLEAAKRAFVLSSVRSSFTIRANKATGKADFNTRMAAAIKAWLESERVAGGDA